METALSRILVADDHWHDRMAYDYCPILFTVLFRTFRTIFKFSSIHI